MDIVERRDATNRVHPSECSVCIAAITSVTTMSDVPPPPPAGTPPPPPPGATPPPPPGAPSSAPALAGGELGKRRSIALVILLAIVTCGIWSVVWSYQNGDELKRSSNDGLGGLVYLLLTLFISPVTMFLMAGEVEQLYRRDGREPPITTIWGLWFLLPVIGNIIWYVRIQNSINDYWTAHGQTNDPGL